MEKGFSTFVIHIKKSENDVSMGWIMNPYIKEYIPFHDLGDMMLKVDENLHQLMEKERQGVPGNLICYHSFRDFTFDSRLQFFYLIQILYTNYHSWQGLLTGTNRSRTTFKSTMDCIRKMDEAIQEKQA